ncbi:MAG: hypothetical protein KVP17_004747 [Porospora cf. gigantea B]|uniref:uncharacterized protein n=1 Tax=Porospora cf. gigantea B TaxID=2853592 RepID=UPI003571B814|nr:MAG: hypothetical protein KVP17_004747 [Porospora cf. gigantea B]
MRQHSLAAFVSKAEGLGVEPATRQWNRERLDATEEFCADAGERVHGSLDLRSILDEDAEDLQAFLEESVVRSQWSNVLVPISSCLREWRTLRTPHLGVSPPESALG